MPPETTTIEGVETQLIQNLPPWVSVNEAAPKRENCWLLARDALGDRVTKKMGLSHSGVSINEKPATIDDAPAMIPERLGYSVKSFVQTPQGIFGIVIPFPAFLFRGLFPIPDRFGALLCRRRDLCRLLLPYIGW
jgi:hypothetical protein